MRILSTLFALAAMAMPALVSSTGIECYPIDCVSYTADFPADAPSQLTTWEGTIGINRFDPNGRTLTKVTVNTKVYFTSTVSVTCNGDTCSDAPDTGGIYNYSGTIYPGMLFKLNIDNPADAARLSNFWGRWGDYPEAGQTARDENNGGAPLFQPYTYPLFDIEGFVPSDFTDLVDFGGARWAFYTPNTDGGVQYWFGTVSSGTLVSGGGQFSDPITYQTSDYSDNAGVYKSSRAKFDFGKGSSNPTAKNTPVFFGPSTFDHFNVGQGAPFSKTIDILSDPNGGLNNDITAQQAANPFIGTGQMTWRANATGIFEAIDTGGNAAKAQVSSAKIAMQVIYEYEGAAFTGDPQFAGFQGQSFQVHGYPGSYFHLVSAPGFQMNGRFTYLASGHCTYKHTTCWTHPGTYIDDLTFIVQELLIRVTAGPVGQGYSVRINDEPFHGHQHLNATDAEHTDHDGIHGTFTPTKFYDAATRLTVHLKSPLELMIRTELFSFTITNADHFFNVASQLMVRPILSVGRKPSVRYPHPVTGAAWFPSYPIHGFIGQTWANARYANNKQYQGDVDDYVETRPYATDSIYSQYNNKFAADMQFD